MFFQKYIYQDRTEYQTQTGSYTYFWREDFWADVDAVLMILQSKKTETLYSPSGLVKIILHFFHCKLLLGSE